MTRRRSGENVEVRSPSCIFISWEGTCKGSAAQLRGKQNCWLRKAEKIQCLGHWGAQYWGKEKIRIGIRTLMGLGQDEVSEVRISKTWWEAKRTRRYAALPKV